jgi:threonine/homoserine/homoserine lactone efflux protein
MPLELLIPFGFASILIFLTPGPAMTLILVNGAAHGARAGLRTVLGNAAGFAVLLAIVLAGLDFVVSHFEAWFAVIRYAGALYLFWLGIQHWRQSSRVGTDRNVGKGRGEFMGGAAVAFANPAALAFLAAFLPQFIDPEADHAVQFAWLAVIFLTACVAVQAILALVADRAGRLLVEDKGALMHRIAAVVLLIGGLLLIFARG